MIISRIAVLTRFGTLEGVSCLVMHLSTLDDAQFRVVQTIISPMQRALIHKTHRGGDVESDHISLVARIIGTGIA